MGRVARYKKIKSFDPFSKKNGGRIVNSLETVGIWGLNDDTAITKRKKRSRVAEALHQRKLAKRQQQQQQQQQQKRKGTNGKRDDDHKNNTINSGDDFDLPPSDAEDDFDMDDMIGSIKKVTVPALLVDPSTLPLGRTVTLKEGLQATIPQTEREEKQVAKLLNIKPEDVVAQRQQQNKNGATTTPTITPGGRMEGESQRDYNRRVKNETRQIIRRERMDRNNPEKRKRKIEFLTEKKKLKKKHKKGTRGCNNEGGHMHDDDDDDDELVTGERAAAAKTASSSIAQDYVRFGEQAERPPDFRHLPRGCCAKKSNHPSTKGSSSSSKTSKTMSDQQIALEQKAMDDLRRKVQAQYATVKRKRKQAGEFHL